MVAAVLGYSIYFAAAVSVAVKDGTQNSQLTSDVGPCS